MRKHTPGFGPAPLADVLARTALPAGASYQVAFSGGADSTALLLALSELGFGARLTALHVNHGFHPAAGEWEDHCRNFCAALGLHFQAFPVRLGESNPAGIEGELRRLRYAVFAQQLTPGDQLLLAHHADDQAETVLLHLLRGSGPAGLAGMPRSRPLGQGLLHRPLLDWTRAQLETWLAERGVDWLRDPANADPRFDRVYLRQEILPRLSERWPHTTRALNQSAAWCREAADLLATSGMLAPGDLLADGSVLHLRPGWLSETPALRQALRQWLAGQGCAPVPAARMEEFSRQLQAAGPDADTRLDWEGHTLRRHGPHLWLDSGAAPEPCRPQRWDGRQAAELGSTSGRFELFNSPASGFGTELELGPRRSGDRLALHPDGPQQALNELLRRAGVPPWLRDAVPVLRQAEEVVAVGDFHLAPGFSEQLAAFGARLTWTPAHAGLRWLSAGRLGPDG